MFAIMMPSLTIMAMIHYMWLMFASPAFASKITSNLDDKFESFGGIASAEGGSALKTKLAVRP